MGLLSYLVLSCLGEKQAAEDSDRLPLGLVLTFLLYCTVGLSGVIFNSATEEKRWKERMKERKHPTK